MKTPALSIHAKQQGRLLVTHAELDRPVVTYPAYAADGPTEESLKSLEWSEWEFTATIGAENTGTIEVSGKLLWRHLDPGLAILQPEPAWWLRRLPWGQRRVLREPLRLNREG